VTRLVGLTGGIASGKSAVADLLADHGAVVIDADLLAHEVTAPGSQALAEIAARFGADLVSPAGALDRAALAQIVFADPEARADLERITHPRIRARSQERISAAIADGAPLVVYSAPLFFEAMLETWIPEVIVVDVDPETQRQRLTARDGAEALARIESQLPLEEKRARASYLIDNRGTPAETAAQVAALWQKLVGVEAAG